MSFGLAMVQLTRATDGFREEFKDALDQKPEKPSEHAERSARLTVMGNDAWKYEMNATVSTGLALIDFDAAKKQRLALTSSERDALVKKLEKTFGVLAHAKGELPGLENSVSVLLDFLTDKDRKTSDAN
jgi:predicted secreted acid phosphatase